MFNNLLAPMQSAKQRNKEGAQARATDATIAPTSDRPKGRDYRFASELADVRVGEKSRLMFAVDDIYYDAP